MKSDTASGRRSLQSLKRHLAGSGRAIGLLLLALGAIVVWQKLSNPYGPSRPPGAHVLLALGLIGGGILLLRDDPTLRLAGTVHEARTKEPRARSPLTLFTLAVAFVATGVGIVLGNLSVVTLSVGQLIALFLAVVGGGLLVGAWWGRARWLIAAGLLLVPVAMITSYIDMPPRGTIGSIHEQPRSTAGIPRRYNLLFGTMTIDLTKLRGFTGTTFTNVNVAAGNVTVYLPERLNLRLAGHIEWGNATVGNGYEDGEDLSFANFYEGAPGSGTLDLDVNGGITSLYVERISQRDRGVPPRADRRGDRPDDRDRRAPRDRRGDPRGARKDDPGDRHGRGDRRGKA